MEQKYGALLHEPDIKLQRDYFKEMCSLLGVRVIYRAPRKDKTWTTYAEIESNYFEPILIDCIFEEHPQQKTMKKLGWDAELQEKESIISVPYDTPQIQVGALFIIPSAIDNAKGRLFRVTALSTIMIYPASITCKLIPEYEDTFSTDSYQFKHDSFTLLNREEEFM